MTEFRPLVSVIMNCFNGAAYLREAMDSVFAQTYSAWEIIFYDNASTDGSAEIACSYGEKVRYFRGETTLSLGAARNAAIALARGELIAFLDTDDRWLPDKLAWQIDAMAADPEVSFVYTNYDKLDSTTGRVKSGCHAIQPEGDVFARFLRYYPVNLQTVMVRRAALEAMDEIFDPALDVSEEYDVFIRLLYRGRARYLPQSTAVYRVHEKMTSVVRNDRYPVENDYILNKLRRAIPDLADKHPREVRYLEAKIGYWYAVSHMARGERLQARAHLRPHRMIAPEFLVLYLATYFPTSVWMRLFALRRALQ